MESKRPATPAEAKPQRLDIVSGYTTARMDVRKACNGIKRFAALGSAAILTGWSSDKAIQAAEKVAYDVLRGVGFDPEDPERSNAVLSLMLEASSVVLADAASRAQYFNQGEAGIERYSASGAAMLTAVAKSRMVARLVEPAYPADMDATVALRVAAAAASAQIAVEVAEFDYVHTPAECIKEASKVMVKAAMDAADEIVPPKASREARLQLTQTLMGACAKVYAAVWRACALDEASRLDAMEEAKREEVLDAMATTPLAVLLAPVHARFQKTLAGVVTAGRDAFDAPQESAPPRSRAVAAKPR